MDYDYPELDPSRFVDLMMSDQESDDNRKKVEQEEPVGVDISADIEEIASDSEDDGGSVGSSSDEVEVVEQGTTQRSTVNKKQHRQSDNCRPKQRKRREDAANNTATKRTKKRRRQALSKETPAVQKQPPTHAEKGGRKASKAASKKASEKQEASTGTGSSKQKQSSTRRDKNKNHQSSSLQNNKSLEEEPVGVEISVDVVDLNSDCEDEKNKKEDSCPEMPASDHTKAANETCCNATKNLEEKINSDEKPAAVQRKRKTPLVISSVFGIKAFQPKVPADGNSRRKERLRERRREYSRKQRRKKSEQNCQEMLGSQSNPSESVQAKETPQSTQSEITSTNNNIACPTQSRVFNQDDATAENTKGEACNEPVGVDMSVDVVDLYQNGEDDGEGDSNEQGCTGTAAGPDMDDRLDANSDSHVDSGTTEGIDTCKGGAMKRSFWQFAAASLSEQPKPDLSLGTNVGTREQSKHQITEKNAFSEARKLPQKKRAKYQETSQITGANASRPTSILSEATSETSLRITSSLQSSAPPAKRKLKKARAPPEGSVDSNSVVELMSEGDDSNSKEIAKQTSTDYEEKSLHDTTPYDVQDKALQSCKGGARKISVSEEAATTGKTDKNAHENESHEFSSKEESPSDGTSEREKQRDAPDLKTGVKNENGPEGDVDPSTCTNFIVVDDDSESDDDEVEVVFVHREAKIPEKHDRFSFKPAKPRDFGATKQVEYVKRPVPPQKRNPSSFMFRPDQDYTFDISRDAAQKMQDRLLQDSLARMRDIGDRCPTRIAKPVNAAPCIGFPIPDIPKHYPNHWKWKDPYARLGLPRRSSAQLVKSHYRRLALLYHPDKAKYQDSTQRFHAITDAYRKLTA